MTLTIIVVGLSITAGALVLFVQKDKIGFSSASVESEKADHSTEPSEFEFDERTNHTSMRLEFVRNGEVASCTSNPAEEERNWLVLMNRDGRFTIEKRTVTYGKVSRTEFGGFSKMRFGDSRSAAFMVTDQGTLKPGQVTTAYLKRSLAEDGMELYADGLSVDDTRDFSVGHRKYRVNVNAATLKGGHQVLALTLERESESQIIWFKSSGYSNVIGELEWVGDMDGDKKLDLLFSSYASNGGQLEGFLFLSSFAVEDNLVGFAGFYTARCRS